MLMTDKEDYRTPETIRATPTSDQGTKPRAIGMRHICKLTTGHKEGHPRTQHHTLTVPDN